MLKRQVKVGKHYRANVSGRTVTVEIVSHSEGRGYYCRNESTGRLVTMRTAGRFIREVLPNTGDGPESLKDLLSF